VLLPGPRTRSAGRVLHDFEFPRSMRRVEVPGGVVRGDLEYAKRYTQRQLQMILGEPRPRVS